MVKVSKYLGKKLARRFRAWDADGSGYLCEEDFVRRARLVASAGGHDVGSVRHLEVQEQFLILWKSLAGEAGVDHLTVEQYCTAFAALVVSHPDGFDAVYGPFIRASAGAVDIDGDGALNRRELRLWYATHLQLPMGVSDHVFDEMVPDPHGVLPIEELVGWVRDYYFNEDPNSPGNKILGEVEP
ncbi:hypothetical protein D5S17_30160 [Pseudonocardiaceae bacterium YIM PH 21723]|nr:hypothetical protein D5S17_30160 [Pseudonocardiaceae bacterium YIM PH 21723]